MIKRIKTIISLVSSMVMGLLFPSIISAQAKIGDLEIVFSSLLSLALTLTGTGLFIMLMVGGFQFISAGSDKEGAQKAQRTITYAIGGIVLAVSAWIIFKLLGNFLGVSFRDFSVCLPGFHLNASGDCI